MDGRAIQIGADVVRRAVHDALAGLLGAPGHMGGDDAVGGSEQGVVRTDGLGVHHIQAGGRQLARFLASVTSCSSISCPRELLIRMAPSFILAMLALLIIFSLSAVRLQWRNTTSD